MCSHWTELRDLGSVHLFIFYVHMATHDKLLSVCGLTWPIIFDSLSEFFNAKFVIRIVVRICTWIAVCNDNVISFCSRLQISVFFIILFFYSACSREATLVCNLFYKNLLMKSSCKNINIQLPPETVHWSLWK